MKQPTQSTTMANLKAILLGQTFYVGHIKYIRLHNNMVTSVCVMRDKNVVLDLLCSKDLELKWKLLYDVR